MRRYLGHDRRRHRPAERRRGGPLVRLLALVEDVEALRGELKPAERRRLGSISGLQDAAHRAWSLAVDPDDARAAFARLAGAEAALTSAGARHRWPRRVAPD